MPASDSVPATTQGDFDIRGVTYLESVEPARALEARILSALSGMSWETIDVPLGPDEDRWTAQLNVNPLREVSLVGGTTIHYLISAVVNDGIQREVSIIIPASPSDGPAIVCIPY